MYQDTLFPGLIEAKRPSKLANIKFSSKTNDWFTSAIIIDAARDVMGDIELDPASCAEANETVKAERYYTKAQRGLVRSWKCRSLWLNPPYGVYKGQSNQGRWSHRLVHEYQQGNVGQGIALVNAYFGYKWFTRLIKISSIAHGYATEEIFREDYEGPTPMPPICFTFDLLSFNAPKNEPEQGKQGNMDKSKYGSAIFYYGKNCARFAEVFQGIGFVVGCS